MSDRNDPIQSLINYANEIKPYHSKIIEVLTEYIYTDAVSITAQENIIFGFGIDVPRVDIRNDLLSNFRGTYGTGPYDSFTEWPVISINPSLIDGAFDTTFPSYNTSNNSVSIPDDQTSVYRSSREVTINLRIQNISDGTYAQESTFDYEIIQSTFVSNDQISGIINNPRTEILLDGDLPVPEIELGSLESDDQVYVATVTIKPLEINSVIAGYANVSQISYTDVPPTGAPLPIPNTATTPDESFDANVYANSIVLDGNVADSFPFGVIIILVLANEREGRFTVGHTYYDFNSNLTYLRVIETINPSDDFSGAVLIEQFSGYDVTSINESLVNSSTGLVQSSIAESISFSWGETGENDVIDGHQFIIKEFDDNTVTVNGSVANIINSGDTINILNSDDNDGTYTVSNITTAGQESEIEVSSILNNSTGGGWLETT